MGTRGLIGTITDNELRGSYNQFDMYPTGVGRDLQKELKELGITPPEAIWDELRPLLKKMRYVDAGDQPPEDYRKAHADERQRVSTGQDWYAYLRDDHGSLVRRLRRGIATDDRDFLQDSLFCEWGYVFDFDDRTVYILKGFNTDPEREWSFCRVDVDAWKPRFKGDRLDYFGCTVLWTGNMQAFLTLDMEVLEESTREDEDEESEAAQA